MIAAFCFQLIFCRYIATIILPNRRAPSTSICASTMHHVVHQIILIYGKESNNYSIRRQMYIQYAGGWTVSDAP
nr:MAG TPA: hypothetical protein [Caudoviricetes sp.]